LILYDGVFSNYNDDGRTIISWYIYIYIYISRDNCSSIIIVTFSYHFFSFYKSYLIKQASFLWIILTIWPNLPRSILQVLSFQSLHFPHINPMFKTYYKLCFTSLSKLYNINHVLPCTNTRAHNYTLKFSDLN
jgi:hypothetical protein